MVSGDFTDFLARIAAHNKEFPGLAYRIIGFARNPVGDAAVVLQQPVVKIQRNAETAEEDIDAELQHRGFMRIPGKTAYEQDSWVSADGQIEITDARPDNVLTGQDGRLYFIDTIIKDSEFTNKSPEELFNAINP